MSKIRNSRIEDAKALLKGEGYFVDNLWTTFDVQSSVLCTDDEAMDILYHAMTDDSVMEHIWYAIKDYALINKFKVKNESSF